MSDTPKGQLSGSTRVAKPLSGLVAGSPAPAVDWSETRRLDVVLLQDTVNWGRLRREIVVGRLAGALVLYTHDVDSDGETYSKTTLPEPLNPWFAFIFRYPPFIRVPYFLHLTPRDPSGIISVESTRNRDGSWENTVDNGVPVSVDVESDSKVRLKALRKALLGNTAAKTGLVLWLSIGFIIVVGVLAYLFRYVW
jgi:hypothetical protein